MIRKISGIAWTLGAVLLVAGCAKAVEDQPVANTTDPFPDGFLWGTATAGFQVDMGCSTPCPDLKSDWYQWATDPDIIAANLTNGDPLEDGPGHWEHYAEDYDLAVEVLHNNAYRMSIEWSRIFTTSTEHAETHEELLAIADMDAVAQYRSMFEAMRARGIEPIATLIHYSMPTWIHDGVDCHFNVDTCENRGWLDGERLIPELAKYAGFAAREYGDLVDIWATMNEPYAIVLAGYVFPSEERTNPPGLTDFDLNYAPVVINNMIEAHARMYDAVHANDLVDANGDGVVTQVGLVPNLAPTEPANPQREYDVIGAENAHQLYNIHMLDALIFGRWDSSFDGEVNEIREDWKGRMDYVGINYYTRLKLIGARSQLAPGIPLFTFLPDMTDLFEVYPRGIYDVSMFVKERYDLPIYITENGTVSQPEETRAAEFVVNHLSWVRRAIAHGADVRGYFYWSLLDNYEWNHGYDMQFGAFGYDVDTKERIEKHLAGVYGEIARENRLTEEVVATYGTATP